MSVSTDFLTKRIRQALLKRFVSASAEKQVSIAVPYWGKGAAKALGLMSVKAKLRIICSLEQAEACNPYEIELLWKKARASNGRVKIKTLGLLHAKVYMTNSWLAVGSANASAKGLGIADLPGDPWEEAMLFTEEVSSVHDAEVWFGQKWESSKEITEEMLCIAKARWNTRPKHVRAPLDGYSVIDFAKQRQASKNAPRVWVVMYASEYGEKSKEEATKKKKELNLNGDEVDHYEVKRKENAGRKQYRAEDIVVDCWLEKGKKHQLSLWQVLPRKSGSKAPLTSDFNVDRRPRSNVYMRRVDGWLPIDSLGSVRLTKSDRKELRERVSSYLKTKLGLTPSSDLSKVDELEELGDLLRKAP